MFIFLSISDLFEHFFSILLLFYCDNVVVKMIKITNKFLLLNICLNRLLTLKAPNKNCSRRHFKFYFYLSKKIRFDFCLACEAEARHMYCFSGGGVVVVGVSGVARHMYCFSVVVGGVNFLCLGHFLGNYKG